MPASSGFKDLLIDDFEIFRGSTTTDNIGGFDVTYNLVNTVKGRLSSRGPTSERDAIDKLEIFVGEVIFMELTDIQREDIVRGEGKLFRVKNVLEPSGMEHHLEVQVERELPERDFNLP